MDKGLFISFEGADGSGKSLQCRLLCDRLRSEGFCVVSTREPGGTPISEKIRSIIMDPENKEMDPMTEALLFASSRAQHVKELIVPSVNEGKIVVCDRFMDSSIAYQGYARGLGDKIRIINEYAVCGVQPDITFFLDISAEKCRERNISAGKADRLELESLAFHEKVYEGFLELSRIYSSRYVVIDGNRAPELIASEIYERLMDYIAENR